eukprot:Ihof_evm1s551 gene=Ihof_evmTU1s551
MADSLMDSTNFVMFCTGMFSVFAAAKMMSYAQWSIKQRLHVQNERIQDGINLNTLGQLTRSENVALQQSAARMLMDRAMQSTNLRDIVDECNSVDKMTRLKAATTLGLLAKTEENKERLAEMGALEGLSRCVVVENDMPLQRVAIMGVFDLVYNNAEARNEIIQNNGLPILVRTARASKGHAHMQKLCCHSLVQLCSTHCNDSDDLIHMQTIVDEGIAPLAVLCLKSDDAELVWWALGLIHELALKDIGKEEIRKSHGVLKAFLQVLTSTESNALIYVLRTLGFLAIRNDEFKMEILNSPILDHVLNNMNFSNTDIVYWTVVLLHDLAMSGEKAATKLLQLDTLIPALVNIVKKNSSKKSEMSLTHLVAETFGFLCSAEKSHLRMMKMGIMVAIQLFLKSDDPEMHFWSAALLLNLTVTSDEVKVMVIQEGGVDMLLDLVASTKKEQVPSMAAKTLVMLGLNSDVVNERVKREVLEVLARNVMELLWQSLSPKCPVSRVSDLNLIGVLARGDHHKISIVEIEGLVECLADMVWYLAHRTPALARLDSSFLYNHGVAAVKCLSVLSSHDECQSKLLYKGAVSSLAALVLSLNLKDDSSADSPPDYQHPSRKLSLAGDYSIEILNESSQADSGAKLLEIERQNQAKVNESKPTKAPEDGVQTTNEEAEGEMTNKKEERRSTSTGNKRDLDLGLLELKQQAVIALANCAIGCCDGRDRSLYCASGALHALWAAALRPSIPAIPFYIETALTSLARPPNKTLRAWTTPVALGLKGQLATTTITTSKQSQTSANLTSVRETPIGLISSENPSSATYSGPLPSGNEAPIGLISSENPSSATYSRPLPSRNEAPIGLISSEKPSLATSAGPLPSGSETPIGLISSENASLATSSAPVPSLVSPPKQDLIGSNCLDAPIGPLQSTDLPVEPPNEPSVTTIDSKASVNTNILFDNTPTNEVERASVSTSSSTSFVSCRPAIEQEQQERSTTNWSPPPSTPTPTGGSLTTACSVPGNGNHDNDTTQTQAGGLSLAPTKPSETREAKPQPTASTVLIPTPTTGPAWMSEMCFWVELNATDKTPGLMLSPDHLSLRNDNWTFESIRSTVYVGAIGSDAAVGGRVGYEVTIKTSGIIQLGWAAPQCRFEPERGVGVGDDKYSYAFDGSRRRAWHGDPGSQQMSSYGKMWLEGDVITILMDVEERTISFCLNGRDMGVAFTDVDVTKRWYPALSLATGQHCSFNFGAVPLKRALPAGYLPLTMVQSPRPQALPMKSRLVVETLEYRTMFESKLAAQRVNDSTPIPTMYFEAVVCKDRASPLEIGMQAGESIIFLMKFMET